MNVLLIGSGGREHALAWKLSASPLLTKLYCAPGNGGIAEVAECVPVAVADHTAVIRFCADNSIDLVVVGPDAPIAAGIVDDLSTAGIKAFGPTQAAGRLESSKRFTKELCRANNIPTAAYGHFHDAESAKAYIRKQGAPIVVKADGLAAGKGVVVAMSEAEALAAVDMMFGGSFGKAGAEVVVEEFMQGEEASFFALCDGVHALPLATAQDHKRAFDGDKGPNTGGMGAYSPAPVLTDALCAQVMDEMIKPALRALSAMGTPYKGVLYAGVMVTEEGPKLVEFNARFGDPETQVLMMRLESDLLPALLASVDGTLDSIDLRWHDDAALTVVLAANGYPGSPEVGSEIKGVEAAAAVEGVQIFHAGTRREGARLLAHGGRVLNVTARGRTVAEAQARAYDAAELIDWPGGFYRHDIGWRAIEREKGSEAGAVGRAPTIKRR
jgi:phosphoribosylamine--glycine ligase